MAIADGSGARSCQEPRCTPVELPARRTERNCSIERTVNILSDAWAFLVTREAFFGARRFEQFRSALDIPRNTLIDRLQRLTSEGILRRASYSGTSLRVEYRLTRSGIDLYPTFIALMQFGDRWLADEENAPLRLIHEQCNQTCKPMVSCSHCLHLVNAESVEYRNGAGAAGKQIQPVRRSRRNHDGFLRGRPSSVSRALDVIGDRWSFLVIREAFFGVCRFDKLQAELGIASNVLADRLKHLVERGIFEKQRYHTERERYNYRLSPMGLELYGPIILMMAWGDRWRAGGRPPLLLKHSGCGHDFIPLAICDQCNAPIDATSMKYQLRYSFGRMTLSQRVIASQRAITM